jgi:hypothetical protein
LGKTVTPEEVFKDGQYIDVVRVLGGKYLVICNCACEMYALEKDK